MSYVFIFILCYFSYSSLLFIYLVLSPFVLSKLFLSKVHFYPMQAQLPKKKNKQSHNLIKKNQKQIKTHTLPLAWPAKPTPMHSCLSTCMHVHSLTHPISAPFPRHFFFCTYSQHKQPPPLPFTLTN